MISFKCKGCGGEMTVDMHGGLCCPYCGSKVPFSDKDFASYREFRLNMLNYLRAMADMKNNEADDTFLWNSADTACYYSNDGTQISINYLFTTVQDGVKSFVGKNSVVFVFAPGDRHKAKKMKENLALLSYPAADLKNLSACFPSIKADIELDDGGMLIAINRPENVFPLYAFGNLREEHTAWIVSRMENICCVLEYSNLIHNGISPDSVYINPKTHEGMLFGGWWKAYNKPSVIFSNPDLLAVRAVANKLLGPYISDAVPLFRAFISEKPSSDAYTDFARWDKVIENGMGGHKFVKFSKD